jgi:hypothetical protein
MKTPPKRAYLFTPKRNSAFLSRITVGAYIEFSMHSKPEGVLINSKLVTVRAFFVWRLGKSHGTCKNCKRALGHVLPKLADFIHHFGKKAGQVKPLSVFFYG